MNRIVIEPKHLCRSRPQALIEPLLRSFIYIAGEIDFIQAEETDQGSLINSHAQAGKKPALKVQVISK